MVRQKVHTLGVLSDIAMVVDLVHPQVFLCLLPLICLRKDLMSMPSCRMCKLLFND